MAFPKTEQELHDQGYEKLNESVCRDDRCVAPLTWWLTPKGKRIPMNRGTAETHFATCIAADSFRGRR